jgi:hypothetical protein
VFRISARTLTEAARRDPQVSWAIAEELNRRLYEVLEQTAVNAFGSVRQRVAAHLLDLAPDRQRPGGRLVAHVSQQELADAAGSVREVVARAPRWPVTLVTWRATEVTDAAVRRRQPGCRERCDRDVPGRARIGGAGEGSISDQHRHRADPPRTPPAARGKLAQGSRPGLVVLPAHDPTAAQRLLDS